MILTDFAFLVKFPDSSRCQGQCTKEHLCLKASRIEYVICSTSCCLPVVAEKFGSWKISYLLNQQNVKELIMGIF